MEDSIAKKTAKILLEINAVTLNLKDPYTFASGILSPVYTDCRILMGHPKERKEIVSYLCDEIKKENGVDVIAGTATAGIPHAAWIADALNLPMIYVRGKAKDHGKGNMIEGVIKSGQNAVVIEDLISTAGSSVSSLKAIRDAGGTASHIFAIITYGMKKADENVASEQGILTALTNFQTVVEVAVSMGKIKGTEQAKILEWTEDPTTWGTNAN